MVNIKDLPENTRLSFIYEGGTKGQIKRFVEFKCIDDHGNMVCKDIRLKMEKVNNPFRKFALVKMSNIKIIRLGGKKNE